MNIIVIRITELSDSDHTYQDWWLWLEWFPPEAADADNICFSEGFAKPFDRVVFGIYIWR